MCFEANKKNVVTMQQKKRPANQSRRWNESVEPLSESWTRLFKKGVTGYALIVFCKQYDNRRESDKMTEKSSQMVQKAKANTDKLRITAYSDDMRSLGW